MRISEIHLYEFRELKSDRQYKRPHFFNEIFEIKLPISQEKRSMRRIE